MDLGTFLSVVWRHRLILLVTALGVVLATGAGLYSMTPHYVASTTLRVGTESTGSPDWPTYDIQYTDRLMNTYKTVVTSEPMAVQVMNQLGLPAKPRINVVIPANTELMEIQVTDVSPERAALVANAVAKLMISQLDAQLPSNGTTAADLLLPQLNQMQSELDQARADYDKLLQASPDNKQALQAAQDAIKVKTDTYTTLLNQYESARNADALHANRMSIVQEATPPARPSSPSKAMILPLALMLGLLGGVALGFLLENFDTRLHSSKAVEAITGLPVLGKIPMAESVRGALFPSRSPQEEAFRRLRTNLLARDASSPLRSVLVTSASPKEGKSTTVANLALAIAQSGRRVVVVDADMRRPSLHTTFEVGNAVGLSSVLSRQLTLDEALQYSMTPGIQILTSGPASSNPAELLGLQQMEDVVRQLERQFDYVLIDTPSLESVTDASILSLIVDEVLLVVARGQTRREMVIGALQELEHVQSAPLGVVVTRAEGSNQYRYGAEPREPRARRAHAPREATAQAPHAGERAGVMVTVPAVGGAEPPRVRRLTEITRDDAESTRDGVDPGASPAAGSR